MRQQREMRGKAEPHGAHTATDAAGSIAKTQALFEAIQRVDRELSRREEIETGKPSPAEFARKALELKMSAEPAHHPDSGRAAKTGMRPKKRTEESTGGTSKKEMFASPRRAKPRRRTRIRARADRPDRLRHLSPAIFRDRFAPIVLAGADATSPFCFATVAFSQQEEDVCNRSGSRGCSRERRRASAGNRQWVRGASGACHSS